MQVFDPVRVFMVEGNLNDWFDYRGMSLTPSSLGVSYLFYRVCDLQVDTRKHRGTIFSVATGY